MRQRTEGPALGLSYGLAVHTFWNNLDGTTTVHPGWPVKGNALRSSNILKRWETAILKRPSCYEATF